MFSATGIKIAQQVFNRRRSLAVAVLVCCAAPVLACTDSEAFGFRFGEALPAGATTNIGISGYGGGSVYGQYRIDVPDPVPNFAIYAAGAITNRRVVYEVTAIRRIADESLMSTPMDNPERGRVKEAAEREVTALLKHYSEKYGFVYERAGYPNHFQWEARTPSLQSRIGVEGVQSIYIECRNRLLYDREHAGAVKDRGGSIWGALR